MHDDVVLQQETIFEPSAIFKATEIAPKFTGLLSLLGDVVVMRELVHTFCGNKKNKQSGTIHRTLFALCIADLAHDTSHLDGHSH